jgi:hypothetical protein
MFSISLQSCKKNFSFLEKSSETRSKLFIGLHAKCYSLMRLELSRQTFEKYWHVKFHEIRAVGAELFHADGQIDTSDEANSCSSQFCGRDWKWMQEAAPKSWCPYANLHSGLSQNTWIFISKAARTLNLAHPELLKSSQKCNPYKNGISQQEEQ